MEVTWFCSALSRSLTGLWRELVVMLSSYSEKKRPHLRMLKQMATNNLLLLMWLRLQRKGIFQFLRRRRSHRCGDGSVFMGPEINGHGMITTMELPYMVLLLGGIVGKCWVTTRWGTACEAVFDSTGVCTVMGR